MTLKLYALTCGYLSLRTAFLMAGEPGRLA
jgi:hypothetical protein